MNSLNRCFPINKGSPPYQQKKGIINPLFGNARVFVIVQRQSYSKRQLEEDKKAAGKINTSRWKPAPINDFYNIVDNSIFEICQLYDVQSVYEEGSKMHHCVSNYISKYSRGSAVLFSMRRMHMGKRERLVTIEVTGDKITEARGACNRNIFNQERGIIRLWAENEGLNMAI